MARVLYVVPDGNDLGGIITSSENLMLGFREAGHTATFAVLKHTGGYHSEPRGKLAGEYLPGPGSGMLMHPLSGWRGRYYSTARPDEFITEANRHDVVVWGALYGLRNKATEGSTKWAQVITGHSARNVFMVRDDHLEERVPWAMALAPYAAAMVGVQRCSYDSLQGLGVPRAVVFSGHAPADPSTALNKRRKAGLALATWKPWKRGRVLLQAAQHLTKLHLEVAGDGIEFRYMRSADKARDRDFNPDGTRIWDAAFANPKVDYLGTVDPAYRDSLLAHSKFMVDFSYRENSGQINRTFVEAMRLGAVPIASPRFVGTDIFDEGEHYLPVDVNAPPHEIAKLLDKYSGMNVDEIRDRNYGMVDQFSRKVAADNLVKLGLGKKAGALYDKNNVDAAKLGRGRAAFAAVFGEL